MSATVRCAVLLGEVVALGLQSALGQVAETSRWQPYDCVFTADAEGANPFAVSLDATVTAPDGRSFSQPGFYDGDGKWKVRVAPDKEGEWSVTTRSPLAALNGRTLPLRCVANANPRVHGGLQIDREHPRHFVFADGSRHFPMGYECDWLWALDLQEPKLKRLDPFLDKLAASGFNFIILNAYAHDTSWRRGKTGPDDFGPPPLFAWEGSNDAPDHSRFQLAYWRHFDRVIEAMHRRGIIAHLMIKVYNKHVNWPKKGSPEDDLYFRWIAARYAAYPNIVWDFSKEANNERDLEYKRDRLRFLRASDPYRRLLTVHDDHATYDRGAYDDLLDFRSDQQHSNWHAMLLEHRKQRAWPVVNVEFGYEAGPKGLADRTYGVTQPIEEVVRRAWEIQLAGGYTAYYYTYTAWDVVRPEDSPPGYEHFRRFREFFETTRYWLLEPADELVSEGYCLADPGKEYVVFQNKAQPFTLKLAGLASPAKTEWFQPLTGKREAGEELGSGERRLQPPKDWGDGPVVLHVLRRTQ